MMVTLNFLPSISSIGESILCLIKKKKGKKKKEWKNVVFTEWFWNI